MRRESFQGLGKDRRLNLLNLAPDAIFVIDPASGRFLAVNRHQGWVEGESTPGKGTIFTVWLPLAQHARRRK